MPGKRNETFIPSRQPLRNHSNLQLDHARVKGPVPFLNPTTAHFQPAIRSEKRTEGEARPTDKRLHDHDERLLPPTSYKWTSRNNRKGRHALSVAPSVYSPESEHRVPHTTASLRKTVRGIMRMFTTFSVWDISYDVAAIFTLGSIIWVINAFLVYLPLVRPETEFDKEVLYGGGITAFIGATIFEFGSILLMLEAVNEHKSGCFGWAIEAAFTHEAESGSGTPSLKASTSTCTHHHSNRRNLVGKSGNTKSPASTSSSESRSWVWFPSIAELRTHYIHELGFLASLAQLIGATIFWIAGFTALPGIYEQFYLGKIIS